MNLQYLPPHERAVLILREMSAWSAVEAAALLDMPVAAIKSAHPAVGECSRPVRTGNPSSPPTPSLRRPVCALRDRRTHRGQRRHHGNHRIRLSTQSSLTALTGPIQDRLCVAARLVPVERCVALLARVVDVERRVRRPSRCMT
ncbi:sigma factor-like helix-turn-helix DNA-binding protein [Amycolatopsis australiensis]|uniref:sigma factor-like helix-turn-helix DNA-binding protein n=1 Tax=Amycolatopsis australiensis TaxID=546364 RepID=UPI000931F10A